MTETPEEKIESQEKKVEAQNKLKFEFATDELRAEIELFWKRSLFFWGFIAAAFVAYGALLKDGVDRDIALSVACFGVVCSVAWSLVNRGSKYWQVIWEEKLKSVESKVLGEEFYTRDEKNKQATFWGASRYSVTRLTTALSDFTVGVWLVLAAKVSPAFSVGHWTCINGAIVAVSVVFIIAMLINGRSRQY